MLSNAVGHFAVCWWGGEGGACSPPHLHPPSLGTNALVAAQLGDSGVQQVQVELRASYDGDLCERRARLVPELGETLHKLHAVHLAHLRTTQPAVSNSPMEARAGRAPIDGCAARAMSSFIFWTRVGNLSLFRSSTNGGFQLGGGTILQEARAV